MQNSMKEEIWKTIPCYKGYEASTLGRVRSKERLIRRNNRYKYYDVIYPSKILSPCKHKNGYLYVELCENGKMKKIGIHRLIGFTFIPNPDNLPQINHKDYNKENNSIENLEWCDAKYNAIHRNKKPTT